MVLCWGGVCRFEPECLGRLMFGLGQAAWLKAGRMEAEGDYRGCKLAKSLASSSVC